MKLRRIVAYILSIVSVGEMCYFVCFYSAIFGWNASFQWLWLSLLSLAIDHLLYDSIVAFTLSQLFKRRKTLARKLKAVRMFKVAGFQE